MLTVGLYSFLFFQAKYFLSVSDSFVELLSFFMVSFDDEFVDLALFGALLLPNFAFKEMFQFIQHSFT